MTAKEIVLAKHPSAACYGCEYEGYKIYYSVGQTRIALSATHASATESWTDAAQALQARDALPKSPPSG